jgi:hypothetical protein
MPNAGDDQETGCGLTTALQEPDAKEANKRHGILIRNVKMQNILDEMKRFDRGVVKCKIF